MKSKAHIRHVNLEGKEKMEVKNMEYVYAALLLHKAGKEINEENVNQILGAAGIKPDPVHRGAQARRGLPLRPAGRVPGARHQAQEVRPDQHRRSHQGFTRNYGRSPSSRRGGSTNCSTGKAC